LDASDQEATPVTKEAAQTISSWCQHVLEKHAANLPESQLASRETFAAVQKRLSENGAKRFTTARSLPLLVAAEVLSWCERVRIYPFTAKYRVQVNNGSSDMVAAWQLHSHSLRQSEVYVLQERGRDIINFAHLVATDLGLGTQNRASRFDKRFKTKFGWRLRDRHRVVHAHERPSLTSRLADMMVATDETTKSFFEDYIVNLLTDIADKLPGDQTDDPKEKLKRLHLVRDVYEKGAEDEATQMIEIFVEELQMTINPPTSIRSD
jgi:hypothetical protein